MNNTSPGNEAISYPALLPRTKLGTHAHTSMSVFKTTTVFFSGKYGFCVLPSSLQSMIHSCPRRTSCSYDGKKALAIVAVNHMVDKCSRFSVSDTLPGRLNGKKFRDCYVL